MLTVLTLAMLTTWKAGLFRVPGACALQYVNRRSRRTGKVEALFGRRTLMLMFAIAFRLRAHLRIPYFRRPLLHRVSTRAEKICTIYQLDHWMAQSSRADGWSRFW